ncbi:MAG: glucokinase [Nanoarchaeota archaeon]|nr:glucokinase [Nanoarchaeota archaeon]
MTIETVLVADIGGTNTTFAFVQNVKEKYSLVHTIHFDSKKIINFTMTTAEVLRLGKLKGYQPRNACFAPAGRVSETYDFSSPTKLTFTIDAAEIKKKTELSSVLVINDFTAVAYGVEVIPDKIIVQLKPGKIINTKPKAILGAGTGLGKALLIWNNKSNQYFPVASEGGHSDAALQTTEEYEMGEFIKRKYARERVVWEDVLSGQGISNIYQFFETRLPSNPEIKKSNYNPALISKSSDAASKAAMDLFIRFYARCAQNLALDTMAFGGVYLAGGITAKNLALFKRKAFIDEFILNHRMKKVLEQIPVFAVTDYNVSLYGAAHALTLHLRGEFP